MFSNSRQLDSADAKATDQTAAPSADDPAIIAWDALRDAPRSGAFLDLIKGTADVVLVKNVASQGQCRQLCDRAAGHGNRRGHDAVDTLSILGTPHYLAVEDAEHAARYYGSAPLVGPFIRELSFPMGSALDGLMAIINDMWPQGLAHGHLDDGKSMPSSIFRIYAEGSLGVEPHIDDLRQEVPASRVANALEAQFGFNLYLSLPSSGGELIVYDNEPTIAEFRAHAVGYSWPQELAGEPRQVIQPEIGMLAIINTRRLHAVGPCIAPGFRATLSGFLGMFDESEPMMIWA